MANDKTTIKPILKLSGDEMREKFNHSSCSSTAHSIVNYVCENTDQIEIPGYAMPVGFFIKQKQNLLFNDASEEKLFLLQFESDYHTFIIEKILVDNECRYIIYQSWQYEFTLDWWLGKDSVNRFDPDSAEIKPCYVDLREKYGKGKILTRQEIEEFLYAIICNVDKIFRIKEQQKNVKCRAFKPSYGVYSCSSKEEPEIICSVASTRLGSDATATAEPKSNDSDQKISIVQSSSENSNAPQLLKLPENLSITLSSELKENFEKLCALLTGNDTNNAITNATQTLLNGTIGQFVQASESKVSKLDEAKMTEAISTYRNSVANLSANQKIFIGAMTFLGLLIGFIAGVLVGSLATGLNPIGALMGGATGAVVGASVGGAAGGSIAFGLTRFGVFQHDPVKAQAQALVQVIEKTTLQRQVLS